MVEKINPDRGGLALVFQAAISGCAGVRYRSRAAETFRYRKLLRCAAPAPLPSGAEPTSSFFQTKSAIQFKMSQFFLEW